MNAVPHTDEDFALALRNLVDDVAPDVTVHVTRVLPAARRRRTRHRIGVAAASVGVLALAAGWAVRSGLWVEASDVQPAGTDLSIVDLQALDADAAAREAAAADAAAEAERAAAAADPASAGWPDAAYWRVTTRTVGTDGHVESREGWYGRGAPGLIVVDGKLDDPGSLIAFGPRGWGRLTIDGVDTIIGWDELAALPADRDALDALLRANVEPDRGQGTPDDKMFEMARELLQGSPAPTALRDALWALLTTLPGSTVVPDAADSTGRVGDAVERPMEYGPYRLVYDTDAHRLLEVTDPAMTETFLDEGPAGPPPVEPTLEMAGCTRWETC